MNLRRFISPSTFTHAQFLAERAQRAPAVHGLLNDMTFPPKLVLEFSYDTWEQIEKDLAAKLRLV